jgi:tripartite ATP-independent transporter DctM subunit
VFIALSAGAVPVSVVASSLVQGIDSFAFLAIPFFFLAGELMNTGGITARLLALANALVGHIRGGMSHVAVLASMIFSGVSGSAVADASAIGSSLIPAMKEQGYPPAYAAAVVAAAATMGPIIPPSIAFVVYALVSEVSVGKLFLAGAVPGLLMGAYLLVTCSIVARRRGFPFSARASARQRWHALKDALPALAMPLIILGGIVGGVTTSTEAGVAAAVYALLVGKFLYRELSWRQIARITQESMVNSGIILLTIAASGIFSWLVANMAIGELGRWPPGRGRHCRLVQPGQGDARLAGHAAHQPRPAVLEPGAARRGLSRAGPPAGAGQGRAPCRPGPSRGRCRRGRR